MAAAEILAAMAGPVWGVFNTAVRNRTQWEFLRGQAEEVRIQADQAEAIGASEVRAFMRTTGYRTGAIASAWGASGFDVNSGSAFESITTQAGFHGIQALQMKRSTAIQVRNLQTSANFLDHSRRILDAQLPMQLINAGLQGASAGGGASSFGALFTAKG